MFLLFGFIFFNQGFVVGRYNDMYLIIPRPIKYFFIKKLVGKWEMGNGKMGFKMIVKLARKRIF